ncbi:Uncharacterized protein FKW44_023384 [Caligus rogercresseyi]|uniref:Uncharacterized protein n=1 Tax=Caligus rogercresseyi TaxID=217165 RepID=A0A7T8GPC9_CALRO|nr:Uncharacterized protein FKW44_023384 [Caligus rogercresseyi]
MESTKGNWSPIHFDYTGTWSYILGGPSALDYAAAVHTLRKVFEDNKAFKPLSHLDFGSGVGTFSWA